MVHYEGYENEGSLCRSADVGVSCFIVGFRRVSEYCGLLREDFIFHQHFSVRTADNQTVDDLVLLRGGIEKKEKGRIYYETDHCYSGCSFGHRLLVH